MRARGTRRLRRGGDGVGGCAMSAGDGGGREGGGLVFERGDGKVGKGDLTE